MIKRIASFLTIFSMPAVFLFPLAYPKVAPYIDAGTGSIIIQAVIAGCLAGLVLIRVFWNRVKSFFKRLFHSGEKHEDAPR